MKMPMNWAKEFAEFECTPQEFADRMTMSGSKVETYECEADGIKNVVVGKILEIVPHPDSDHMVVWTWAAMRRYRSSQAQTT